MKKVSLLEVSAFVVVAAVASATVNADDNAIEPQLKSSQAKKAVEVIEPNVIFAPLDVDKNGLISKQELGVGNELLKKQFDQIDTNNDQGISEQELKTYLASVDVKINL